MTLYALSCAKCGSAMTLRRNRESGDPFLGCRSFPACRHTEMYDEAIGELQAEVASLRRRLEVREYLGAAATPGNAAHVDRSLKRMLFEFHPDRCETVPALEITVALNRLRQEMAA